MKFLALVAAFGVEKLLALTSTERAHRRALILVACLVLSSSLYFGTRLVGNMAEDESFVRINPVIEACAQTPSNSFLLTLEPILPSLLCGPERNVIALTLLGDGMSRAQLSTRLRASRGFFYEPRGGDVDRVRYASAYDILEDFGVVPRHGSDSEGAPRLLELMRP